MLIFARLSLAQYLGKILSTSYDPLRGNPVPTSDNLIDEGYKITEIFEFEYTQNKKSEDGKYSIPDGLDIMQMKSCSYKSDVYNFFGEKSYYEFLSQSVSVSAKYKGLFAGGSFSMSTDFQRISKQTTQSYKVFLASTAKCTVYAASLQKNAKVKLTANFMKEILKLIDRNVEDDEQMFFEFFETFGICYITKAVYGAQAIIESEFSRVTYDTLDWQKFSFKTAAKASFLGFTGSTSYLSTTEKSLATKFDESRDSTKQIFIGSAPSTDGKWESWAQNVDKSPMPIKIELEYLYELITNQYIPNIDEDSLESMREMLKIALEKYCFNKVGSRCFGPKPDFPYAKYTIVKKQSALTYEVKCPDGYFLNSVLSRRTNAYDESFWYEAVDQYTGRCKDSYGS